jgi:ribonuclease HI
MLFTDGSVDIKTRIGFGAYLAINSVDLSLTDLKTKVKVKKFENTSSTTLELQTLLWAMDDAFLLHTEKTMRVAVYSDSQNILSLLVRRSGLEEQEYFSRNGKRLNNTDLYRQFFTAIDQCNCQIIKVDGHKPRHSKNDIDRLFTLVDKASRFALREFNRPTAPSLSKVHLPPLIPAEQSAAPVA